MFGFTEDETLKFLKDYDLEYCFPIVKEYYGGYKFYDKEIFNPVDVVNFVKNNFEQKRKGIASEIKTDTYWCDLVSNKDKELKEKYKIKRARVHKNMLVIKLEGINDAITIVNSLP